MAYMDISKLRNVTSEVIKAAEANKSPVYNVLGTPEENNDFSSIFARAMQNIDTTNAYLSDAENEEIKLAMGEATSTHDLAIALQKASTALQYTVTVKNSFMEAYRTLINMQI